VGVRTCSVDQQQGLLLIHSQAIFLCYNTPTLSTASLPPERYKWLSKLLNYCSATGVLSMHPGLLREALSCMRVCWLPIQ
jgi:hypothetical protein